MALYSLILEDHTVFMNRQRRGLLRLPSEDKNADMYEYIMDILAKMVIITMKFQILAYQDLRANII